MSVIKKNIIANFGGTAWQALMSLAFVPMYIKFMGIESYGLVGIFASLLALFGLLDLGLSTTMIRELAKLSALPDKIKEMRNLVRTIELPYWGISFFIAFIIVVLSGPMANYWIRSVNLTPDTVRNSLLIMGLVVAFRWPIALYSGGLMGLQKQVLLNGINIFAATLRGVGAVLILWLISPTIQAFFVWQIFTSIVHVTLTAGFLWHNIHEAGHRPRFEKELLVNIWRFAAGMTFISLTSIILMQTDKIILSKLLTLEMFGYYTLATAAANTIRFFISPIFIATFPRLSQLVSDNNEMTLEAFYHRSCQFMSVMILPVALVVSFFSSELLFFWTGDSLTVANTHLIVSIVIIGTTLNGLMNIPYGLQLANSWTKLPLCVNIIAIIILVPLIYILAKQYGGVGAAIAWLILNTGYVLISIQIMHRRLLKGDQWRWYFIDVGLPLLVSFLVVLTFNVFMPVEMSRMEIFAYLTVVSATTLFTVAMVTPVTREFFGQKIVGKSLFGRT